MKLNKAERELVESMCVARVSTVNSDGVLHNVPVCPIFYGDRVYFGTAKKARKLRNLKAHPNVTVVFDEYTEDWDFLRGVMIQGKGRIVGATEFRKLRKQIYAKYLQYESKAGLGERDSAIVEVDPENKFSWGLE